ncbi:MAG: DUF1611 domain-containing protein [Planctomycetes bacterium]|nr:DUF1611 domain-containing protein [Planctomycetota bacterium]
MTNCHRELQLVDSAPKHDTTILQPLSRERLARAKAAYSTRRLDAGRVHGLLTGNLVPAAGDLVLARVDRPRHHPRLELVDGRRAYLHPGDEIVVAFGNRYAPDQFHAVVPQGLGECHLVAAGGIAGRCIARHASTRPATEIDAMGVLADAAGARLNLRDFALGPPAAQRSSPVVVAIAGSSMNAGKTTTAEQLALGLSRHGWRVGAGKVTGTAAGGDAWRLRDAGAWPVIDFTDAGHASTYCLPAPEVERVFDRIVAGIAQAGVDVAVIEIADGLLQAETARLLESERFRQTVDHVLFAAGDALSALHGAAWLGERGLPLRLVTGAIGQSPLAMQEAAGCLDVAVLPPSALADPDTATALARPPVAAMAGLAESC